MSESPSVSFSTLVGGLRLDALLGEVLPGVSRRIAREACSNKTVRVNGRISKGGELVSARSVIEISQLNRQSSSRALAPADVEIPTVLYEDEELLIVSKPRCLHSVTLREDDPVTLADMIATHWPPCREASPDSRESGLVQRLDYYTSGAVAACKDRAAWDFMRKLITSEQVRKTYLALVEGTPEGEFECVSEIDGVERKTNVEVVQQLDGTAAIVRAKARRAARHQVRVHLAAVGHPLVGDVDYGASRELSDFNRKLGEGFLLHAESISFMRPGTKATLSVRAPSAEIEGLLQRYKN